MSSARGVARVGMGSCGGGRGVLDMVLLTVRDIMAECGGLIEGRHGVEGWKLAR